MDSWTTVTNKKKNKKKTINKINIKTVKTLKTNVKKKPKLNNNVKEKILRYCELKQNDYKIFHTWKHFYIMGNCLNSKILNHNSQSKVLLQTLKQ